MPELDTTKLCKDCKNAIVYGLPRGCYCQLTKKADGINPVTGEPQTHTQSCGFTRSEHGYCGPEGKYFMRRDSVPTWGDLFRRIFRR